MLLWWWYWKKKKKKKKKNSVRLRFWLCISMAGYNHSQVWLAEFVGTTILVLLGLGGVANGVLPGTKGHGFGILGVALSFALGIFIAQQCVGHISGFFNPAIALAGAVVGNIHWTHFWICFSAEFVGGFFAAILVWISYFPHFQSLEQVDPTCTCCDLETHGIAIIRQELSAAARSYVSAGSRQLQGKMRKIQPHDDDDDEEHPVTSVFQALLKKVKPMHVCKLGPNGKPDDACGIKVHGAKTMAMADVCSSVRQRIIEDQEVKLSVFASRPSVRQQYWLSCVWSECFYAGLLSFAVLSISNRGSLAIIATPEVSLFKEELQPLFTGLLIFVIIIGGGGITGPALNPARDLGPRFAHWILPIPGKGSSEWWYAWVPLVGPFIGAAIGGIFAKAMKHVLVDGLA